MRARAIERCTLAPREQAVERPVPGGKISVELRYRAGAVDPYPALEPAPPDGERHRRQGEAALVAAEPARELDRAGVTRWLVKRVEDLQQPDKARMVQIVAEVERAARPRDIADDMDVAAEELQVGVDGECLPIDLQPAAEAEGAIVPAARQLGRDNAQRPLELRPVHVESELSGRRIQQAFDHAAKTGRGAAEIADAELADGHLAVLQRAGEMHIAHGLAMPAERLTRASRLRSKRDSGPPPGAGAAVPPPRSRPRRVGGRTLAADRRRD